MNKAPSHELISGGDPDSRLAPLDLLNARERQPVGGLWADRGAWERAVSREGDTPGHHVTPRRGRSLQVPVRSQGREATDLATLTGPEGSLTPDLLLLSMMRTLPSKAAVCHREPASNYRHSTWSVVVKRFCHIRKP